MADFYKTRNQTISAVIIQINPFYGCLKASSNRYLLFTVHSLSSNRDIFKLRSYKRLLTSDCLALIQSASLLRRLVNLATHCSSMREFHQFQAAAWFVITWLKRGSTINRSLLCPITSTDLIRSSFVALVINGDIPTMNRSVFCCLPGPTDTGVWSFSMRHYKGYH